MPISVAPTPLVLLKDFPFAGAASQVFYTDWVPVDSEFQNAQIHVHCQTIAPMPTAFGLSVKIHTSFDTVEAYVVGSAFTVVAPGSQSTAISSELGPMVRVEIAVSEPTTMYAILSVWLQPKSD